MKHKQRRTDAKHGRPMTPAAASPVQPLLHAALQRYQAGRLGEAEQLYRQILAADPRHADSLHFLGIIAFQTGRHAAAIDLIGQAIALRNDVPSYCNNLGLVLQSRGRFADAAAQYARAIALKPDYAAAHSNLGNALKAQGSLPEAAAQYRRALACNPNFAEAENNLGSAMQEQGSLDEARVHYHRALALRPDYPEAYGNLGNTLLKQGNVAAAQRAYEQAIALAPTKPLYYRHLFDMGRVAAGDGRFAAAVKLAQALPSLPLEDQKELHFALGKAYADQKEFQVSSQHFLAGNALMRRGVVYDEQETMDIFARIRAVFTADLLRAKRGAGDPSPAPVFIVGMPRSGTTLAEQILAGHPQVFAAGELNELQQVVLRLSAHGGASTCFPEAVPSLPAEELRQLGRNYLDAVEPACGGAIRFTDKMPQNFCFLGLIHLALPNARIIHMRRDPLDTCLSCFTQQFGDSQRYTYDLGELGRYYRAYQAMMEHWRRVLPAGVMLEVGYEDLVADTERQARRIVAHCGLQWNDACLAFHAAQRPVLTVSAAQVRQPIYHSSVGRWRPYGELLRPVINELGLAA